MFAHQMATHTPDAALLAKQSGVLLERPPLPGLEAARHLENDLYFAHFGSLALHQAGGEAWSRWWPPVKAALLKTQQPDGSWPADFDRWLDPGTDQAELLPLLRPAPADVMEAVEVGPLVNSPKNDGPECLASA